MTANAKPRVTIEAVITRADGTKIDMGIIASTKENIFKKLLRRIK